jgi:hypothetical protein
MIFHFAFMGIYKATFRCLARFKHTILFYINVNVKEKTLATPMRQIFCETIFCAGNGIGHFAALKQNYLEENHILGTRLNFVFERAKMNQQNTLFASSWWVLTKLLFTCLARVKHTSLFCSNISER